MKKYLLVCGEAMEKKFLLLLQSRQHFVDTSDVYSMQDLMDIITDSLLGELAQIHSQWAQHIKTDCQVNYLIWNISIGNFCVAFKAWWHIGIFLYGVHPSVHLSTHLPACLSVQSYFLVVTLHIYISLLYHGQSMVPPRYFMSNVHLPMHLFDVLSHFVKGHIFFSMQGIFMKLVASIHLKESNLQVSVKVMLKIRPMADDTHVS